MHGHLAGPSEEIARQPGRIVRHLVGSSYTGVTVGSGLASCSPYSVGASLDELVARTVNVRCEALDCGALLEARSPASLL